MQPKINYDKEMTNIISQLKDHKKLLLHSCCAPCSSTCIERLTPYFDITILYYNPNIEPYDEYIKRKNEEIRFIREYPNINKLDIIDCDYDNEKFLDIAKGLEDEPERGKRCLKCYNLRMEYTANKAKELGYDYFATTLTLSPLKDSQVLNNIGYAIVKELEFCICLVILKSKMVIKEVLNFLKNITYIARIFVAVSIQKKF